MITARPPHASRVRNLLSRMNDQLAVGITATEGSGTALSNIVNRLVLSDLASADGTSAFPTITSATGGFNARMIGKTILFTVAGDWTVASAVITGVPDANTLEVLGPIGAVDSLSSGSGVICETGRPDGLDWGLTIGGSGHSWSGEVLSLAGTSTLTGPSNTTGAILTFNRGSMLFRFTVPTGGVIGTAETPAWVTVINNGVASSTNGYFAIELSAAGVRVSRRAVNVTTTLTGAKALTAGDEIIVHFRWRTDDGRWEIMVRREDDAPASNSATFPTASVTLGITRSFAFLIGLEADFLGWAWWDCEHDDLAREDYVSDPDLWARPLISGDLTPYRATPFMGRPQADGITFQLCGSATVTLGTPAEQIRIRGWDNPYRVGTAAFATAAHTMASGDADQPIRWVVTGLDAGQYFWVAEISYDGGTTWYPFPGGPGIVWIGTGGRVPWITDGHSGNSPMSEVAYGHDLGRLAAPANQNGPDTMARLWKTADDICDHVRAEKMRYGIFVGDEIWNSLPTGKHGWEIGYEKVHARLPQLHVRGNHDDAGGRNQRVKPADQATDRISQALSMVRWMTRTCNPDVDTYALGGGVPSALDEGAPVAPADDVSAWRPGNTWIDPQSTGGETYANDFLITNPAGSTFVEKLGHNGSNRGSTWAIPDGDYLHIGLDVETWSAIGSGNANDIRDTPYHVLGEAQWAWLESVVANATQPYIILYMHNRPGGIPVTQFDEYGRGSMADGPRTAEEWRLHRFAKANALLAIVFGHDHVEEHVVYDGVHYYSVATAGTSARFGQTLGPDLGAPAPQINYGRASKNGQDKANVRSYRAQWGYSILDLTTRIVEARQTSIDAITMRGQAELTSNATSKWVGCWVSEPIQVQAGGVVPLSEKPRGVYAVCAAADGDFATDGRSAPIMAHADWATNTAGYVRTGQSWGASGSGIPVWEHQEPHIAAQIVVDTAKHPVGSYVRVHFEPRTVSLSQLAQARPASGGGVQRVGASRIS